MDPDPEASTQIKQAVSRIRSLVPPGSIQGRARKSSATLSESRDHPTSNLRSAKILESRPPAHLRSCNQPDRIHPSLESEHPAGYRRPRAILPRCPCQSDCCARMSTNRGNLTFKSERNGEFPGKRDVNEIVRFVSRISLGWRGQKDGSSDPMSDRDADPPRGSPEIGTRILPPSKGVRHSCAISAAGRFSGTSSAKG